MRGKTTENQLGGHRRRRLGFLRRVLVGFGVVVGVVGVPFGVGAVQNIFTGFGAITDIQFEGQDIDKVVYQGVTIWERTVLPALQHYTAANCPVARTRVIDARDQATYWIRKIGNLCWMETNLAYAGGGDNTYGDVIAVGTSTSTLNVVSSATLSGSTDDASCYYNGSRACVYTAVPGGNRTTGTTNPSTSTNGTGQNGYYYNWCAAMGIQSAACQMNSGTQPNQSVNGGTGATQYNICPKGWRLPTSGNGGGEFASVVAALGWTSGAPTPIFTNGLYMFSGRWRGGSSGFQGTDGYYWSSTVYSYREAYYLYIYGTTVAPTGNVEKRSGNPVRCVAP